MINFFTERRDSVYDEGNAFNGSGYATIEEYVGEQSMPNKVQTSSYLFSN